MFEIQQTVHGLHVFAFFMCVLNVTDEHVKPRFKKTITI